MALDFDRERARMVVEQLQGRGIESPGVLAALRRVPRHRFVDPALSERAYEDTPLPIGEQQTISQPYMVALMTEALAIEPGARVLEVGTGSGYQAAVLGELGARVITLERIPGLASRAQAVLDALGYRDRVTVELADGTHGWPERAPFDGIVVTAGAPAIPRPLVGQLAPGARLVLPMGDEELQTLVAIHREPDGRLVEECFGECRFVKLRGEYGWEDP